MTTTEFSSSSNALSGLWARIVMSIPSTVDPPTRERRNSRLQSANLPYMSLLSLSFVQSRKLTTNPHAPGTSIPCTFRTSGGRDCSPVAAARASSMSRVSPAAFEDSCRPRLLSSPTEDASLTSGLVHSARWPQMSSVYNVKYTHFFGRGGGRQEKPQRGRQGR